MKKETKIIFVTAGIMLFIGLLIVLSVLLYKSIVWEKDIKPEIIGDATLKVVEDTTQEAEEITQEIEQICTNSCSIYSNQRPYPDCTCYIIECANTCLYDQHAYPDCSCYKDECYNIMESKCVDKTHYVRCEFISNKEGYGWGLPEYCGDGWECEDAGICTKLRNFNIN